MNDGIEVAQQEGRTIMVTTQQRPQAQQETGETFRPMHYTFEWIPADRLFTDMTYQRPLSAQKVKKIVDKWDWNSIGSLMVSSRGDGTYAIMDGQHRHGAVKALGLNDLAMPCLVYHGLTIEQESWVFFNVNTGRGMPNAVIVFKARLAANEAVACAIRGIVEEAGFTTPDHVSDNRGNAIMAVSALETVYERGGEHDLATVLRIIGNAYGNDHNALKGVFLIGLYAFIAHYRTVYAEQRLTDQLRKTPATTILRAGKQMTDGGMMTREGGVGAAPGAIARVITQLYNTKLTSRRLPAWESA
jgi:hypothetical protein